MILPRTITYARLREVLLYDHNVGYWLWLKPTGRRAKAGTRAGYVSPSDGYRYVGIDGQKTPEHILAWFYMTGEWPQHEIDHKDRNRQNCAWDNLRTATSSQNKMNRGPNSVNTSGIKGVSWRKDRNKWDVRVMVEKKNFYIGLFSDLQEATEAYNAAALRLHKEYACLS